MAPGPALLFKGLEAEDPDVKVRKIQADLAHKDVVLAALCNHVKGTKLKRPNSLSKNYNKHAPSPPKKDHHRNAPPTKELWMDYMNHWESQMDEHVTNTKGKMGNILNGVPWMRTGKETLLVDVNDDGRPKEPDNNNKDNKEEDVKEDNVNFNHSVNNYLDIMVEDFVGLLLTKLEMLQDL